VNTKSGRQQNFLRRSRPPRTSKNNLLKKRGIGWERLETRSLLAVSWDPRLNEHAFGIADDARSLSEPHDDVGAVSPVSSSDDGGGVAGGVCPTCGAAWCVAHLDPDGNIAYALSPSPDDGHGSVGTDAGDLIALAPLSETFRLHSRPTATKTIFLDVDGHETIGTAWNTSKGLNTITTPALSLDAHSSFSDTELLVIQNLWAAVSEDFAPFDVNVTTQAPSIDDLRKTGGSDDRWGIRVCIGGNNQWFGSAGGVAYLNSFNWDSDTPTFVFWDNAGRSAESAGMVTSHEVGHTLGLNHWGTTSQSYYGGHGTGDTSWGPIMGAPYGRNVTTWSRGEYANASQTRDYFNVPQEDLTTITTRNGFSFRTDDFGDTMSTAHNPVVVGGTAIATSGVIERPEDVDAFRFFTAGTLKVTVSPSPVSPNLDIVAQVWNASGEPIYTSNPIESLSASVNLTVGPGTYFLAVRGDGTGDRMGTGYADYGSLGQYTITATVTARPRITAVNDDVDPFRGLVPNGGVTNDTRLEITGTAAPGSLVTIRNGETVLGTGTAMASGAWSLVTAPLSDGRYVLRASASMGGEAGGDSETNYVVTVDTIAPPPPLVSSVQDDRGDIQGVIVSGGRTDDATLRITGTAEASSIVTILVASTVIGTTTATNQGTWTFVTSPLAEGSHVFTARVDDVAGNVSGASAPYTVDVDLTPPPVPILSQVGSDVPAPVLISNGGITNDATPVVTGTAVPGTTITVFANAAPLGTTVTGTGGTWTFTTGTLPDATYGFTARSSDDVGNASLPSSPPYVVTIDTSTMIPVFDRAEDDVAPVVGVVLKGGVTNDPTPSLIGRAEAGSVVTVVSGGIAIGSAVVNSDGFWSFTTGQLIDGALSLTAVAVDRAGNTSDSSVLFLISIDTQVLPPVLTTVSDDLALLTGVIGDGGLTNDNRPTIAGRGEPGSVVTVRVGAVSFAPVPVAVDGTWSMTAGPLTDGSHGFVATAVDRAGNESAPSIPYTVRIDTAVAAPEIVALIDNVPLYEGVVDRDGLTNDASPTVNGSAEPGSVVTLRAAGATIGSGVAGTSGAWSITVSPLSDGVHAIVATAIDPAGNTSGEAVTFRFTVDTMIARPVVMTSSDDDRGDSGRLARGAVTHQTRPAFAGTAEAGVGVTLEAGGRTFGPVASRGDGTWSVKSGTLANGSYMFAARATDQAGNVSPLSDAFPLTIDTIAPVPTITAVWDDVPDFVGPIPDVGKTNDALVSVLGTAEPGNLVVVAVNAIALAEIVAATDGTWVATLPRLSDGTVVIGASATDAAGNRGVAQSPFVMTIDTQSSRPTIVAVSDDAPPLIGPITPGGVTNDPSLFFSGTADPGDFVTVRAGERRFGPVTATGDGRWSLNASGLPDGVFDFSVVARDDAGNTSAAEDRFTITVDTFASAPAITGLGEDESAASSARGAPRLASASPTLVGNAEPGHQVWVESGGSIFGPALSDSSGRWSLTIPRRSDGVHDFVAWAIDRAGNSSIRSTPEFSIRVDTIAPLVALFSSPSPDGTYGIGETIALVAVFSEWVSPAGSITVTLATGRSASLVVDSSGLSANGVYTVGVGDVASQFDILGITQVERVRDMAGNALLATPAVPSGSSFGSTRRIMVNGAVTGMPTAGFSTDADRLSTRRVAATRIPIAFSTPVTGLTVDDFRLSLNGRSVSLRGASLQGGGATYTLILPRRRSHPRGAYALEVVARPEIQAAANGSTLSDGVAWYWRQGPEGQSRSTLRRRSSGT
jgi:hypothetical protein